ncbi:hypothetical protein M413DRAFT_448959 [Hebeloma cylindrosporum]|uniref:Uncharacterized protein n=1 Tax=Hebeloma cylindrosporum TaxID=76867 RepID=A0A0C3BXQ6_HEBCY|nr:hypothetical protein M413DRAFT_448959 [Hebeloma cylindrosporum h7]
MDSAVADVCKTVSEPLARALVKEGQEPASEVNALLVQVVLEMYSVHFISSKIGTWFPGSGETSDFLFSIYKGIRRTEESTVSGRWRTLTRSQIRPTSVGWKVEFMEGLGNILKITAWDIGSHIIAFERKLPAICKAVEELRVALGEKVTSMDLETSIAPPGMPFDPGWMEDCYGSALRGNIKKSAEIVAGRTVRTGIGLRKVIPPSSSGESVLSPKVVLISTLQDVLCPPSAAKTPPSVYSDPTIGFTKTTGSEHNRCLLDGR